METRPTIFRWAVSRATWDQEQPVFLQHVGAEVWRRAAQAHGASVPDLARDYTVVFRGVTEVDTNPAMLTAEFRLVRGRAVAP